MRQALAVDACVGKVSHVTLPGSLPDLPLQRHNKAVLELDQPILQQLIPRCLNPWWMLSTDLDSNSNLLLSSPVNHAAYAQ